jgi:alkanesulfonate monooxygenase SsuD/methylene tetrahydromethanopterin reductase-like flavin-dependent oxidoreductase (luciferase family)
VKVGVALNMLQKPGLSDAAVFAEHMALGDLAEPLGFDSLFALEHHFTGYAMSPSPTQLLSYYAGRTKRITLGTAVIVLPWHDPIRVAEQIALLDVMSGGRCLFGFGRGAASVEYAGFRIPMEEARPRRSSSPRSPTTRSSGRASSSRSRARRSVRARSRTPSAASMRRP